MLTTEVAVVGGGPAGAAAAVALTRAGAEVVLVDRASFPREKCCGDGLTAAALRELVRMGLRPETVPGWQAVGRTWVRGPDGYTVCFPMSADQGQLAACAPRAELDAAVLGLARAAGAKVHDGHALTGARASGDRVELDVDGLGTVRADFAVGADGMWSPLRKALGLSPPGYLGEWHAFRQYFSGVGPAAADLWVWFEPDLLPGYAWSFPLPGGRANVGFGMHRGRGIPTREMKALWPELLARPHVARVLGGGARPEAPHKAWPIPARVDAATLVGAGGRVLFAGDAACATDPLTGEGIAQALLTGRWAAEAITGAGPGPAQVAGAYRAAVRRGLVADHRLSTGLSRAIAHRRGVGAALRLAGSTAWSRRHFARWLFEDYPRAVLLTPRRWHRGTLRGRGPFEAGTDDGTVGPEHDGGVGPWRQ